MALLPFPTAYLCKAGFSTLAVINSKYHNELQLEDVIRCALTTIIPDFDMPMKQV